VLSKFRNIDMLAALDQHCSDNVYGRVILPRVQPNRALKLANSLKLMVTLKRIPPVVSFEHADESRYQLFVKTLWQGIYQDCTGYTVLLVPSYFDFVRLKTFFKGKNAQVAMINEYTDRKTAQ